MVSFCVSGLLIGYVCTIKLHDFGTTSLISDVPGRLEFIQEPGQMVRMQQFEYLQASSFRSIFLGIGGLNGSILQMRTFHCPNFL